jgi:hypothetical protein
MNIQAMRDELAHRTKALRNAYRTPYLCGRFGEGIYARLCECERTLRVIQRHTRPERFNRGEE